MRILQSIYFLIVSRVLLFASQLSTHVWRYAITHRDAYPFDYVGFDFDGVINPFTNGYQGKGVFEEHPDGELTNFIQDLHSWGFRIAIISARMIDPGEREHMQQYLELYGIPYDLITHIKIPCVFLVDDRVIYHKHGMPVSELRKDALGKILDFPHLRKNVCLEKLQEEFALCNKKSDERSSEG